MLLIMFSVRMAHARYTVVCLCLCVPAVPLVQVIVSMASRHLDFDSCICKLKLSFFSYC